MPKEAPPKDTQTPVGPPIIEAAQPERRLSAVLVADVAGYSRLMQADEGGTHARMMRLRAEIIKPLIATHHGRPVKDTGDGFLAMFDSAHDATLCAVALQRDLSAADADQPANSRIYFRMGINVAEVIVEVAYPVDSGCSFAPFPACGPARGRHRRPTALAAILE